MTPFALNNIPQQLQAQQELRQRQQEANMRAAQWAKEFSDRQDAENKKLLTQSKAADLLFSSSPEMQQSLGLTPDRWKTLGALDKIAAMQAIEEKQKLQAFEQGRQSEIARLAEFQERTKANADFEQFVRSVGEQTSGRADLSEYYNPNATTNPEALGWLEYHAGTDGNPGFAALPGKRKPLEEALMNGLIQHPKAALSPYFNRSLDSLREFLPEGSEEMVLKHHEDPVSGFRHVTFGNQLQTSGVNPAKLKTGVEEQFASDGTLLGYIVHAGKTSRFIEAKRGLTDVQKAELKARLQTLHEAHQGGDIKTADELDSRIKEVTGEYRSTRSPASGNSYKVGGVYQGGLRYRGGPPNNPSSWEQVK